jgi:hypothetical protein
MKMPRKLEEQLRAKLSDFDKQLIDVDLCPDEVNSLVIQIRLLRDILEVKEMNWTI